MSQAISLRAGPAWAVALALAGAVAACGSAASSRPARPAGSEAPVPASEAAAPSPPAFTVRLEPIAAEAGGDVGVGIVHVESGRRASLRGQERFPMASVYKLPIAIAFLRGVDAGQASLEQKVSYGAADLRPGLANSAINARARSGTATATAGELLSAMLVESDNTASDLILRRAGGPEAVMARLREAGIEGVDVSRPEGRMLLDYWGVASPPPPSEWTLATFARLRRPLTAEQRRAAAERFASDPRDTATPDGMAALLARLQEGALLSPESTAWLLGTMGRATTGPGRLKGLLPSGTTVAHKTGTGGDTAGVNCCTNDVGIVTLPNGEHVAIAVFVRSSPKPLAARERAIARIAQAAYQHWTKGAQPTVPPASPGGGGDGDGGGGSGFSSGGGVARVSGGGSGDGSTAGAGAGADGGGVGRGEGGSAVGRGDDGVNDRRGGVPLGDGVGRARGDAAAIPGTAAVPAASRAGAGESTTDPAAAGDGTIAAFGLAFSGGGRRSAEAGDSSGRGDGAPIPVVAALKRRMRMAATSAAANMLMIQA